MKTVNLRLLVADDVDVELLAVEFMREAVDARGPLVHAAVQLVYDEDDRLVPSGTSRAPRLGRAARVLARPDGSAWPTVRWNGEEL